MNKIIISLLLYDKENTGLLLSELSKGSVLGVPIKDKKLVPCENSPKHQDLIVEFFENNNRNAEKVWSYCLGILRGMELKK